MAAMNVYGQDGLDRMVERRGDIEWFERTLVDDATQFIASWRERVPVIDGAEGTRLAGVSHRALAALKRGRPVLLGSVGEAVYVGIDVTQNDEADVLATLPEGGRYAELREIGALLPGADAGMAASHRGVLLWHAAQGHCGKCGSPTLIADAGHTLKCTNTECAVSHHPRIDPAVITLVTYGDRVLLGRNGRRPGSVFTCFAGFVEPGESIEGAAAREVYEEVGAHLASVTYHSSQPWPFPGGIMLGFTAVATGTEIDLGHDDEIAEARWFTREELRAITPDGPVQLPRGDSVARRMISGWIEGEA